MQWHAFPNPRLKGYGIRKNKRCNNQEFVSECRIFQQIYHVHLFTIKPNKCNFFHKFTILKSRGSNAPMHLTQAGSRQDVFQRT